MIAAGCCLGLVKLLFLTNGCRLLMGSTSGAGGTDGVHICWGKVGAGMDCKGVQWGWHWVGAQVRERCHS